MTRVHRALAVLALVAAAAGPVAAQRTVTVGGEPELERLADEIERLSTLSGGTMGVAALHMETGRAVFLNRAERFPMASSYKVPIAVQLLTRVERGEISLDSMIAVRPGDLHPGSGTLSELFDDPGVVLSLRNYLELMLLISDNSATDVVLRMAGGAAAVTERMRSLGIDGIRVDRPTIELIADWLGVPGLSESGEVPPDQFRELSGRVTQAERDSAARAFDVDPQDTATPAGMAELLRQLWRREALSDANVALLLDIMTRSTTGAGRIKGMLPPAVEVAHKTGTIGGTTNDVGIVTLPGDAGHVVTVLFVKESTLPVAERERAIAQVARAVYDYFLFRPSKSLP